MSARHSFYDIHGLVGMQIIEQGRGGFSRWARLDEPFTSFRVDSLPGVPDVTLELGEFEPNIQNCYLVDHKYHVRHNYLYCEDGWRSFRWRIEIEGFESGPTHVRLSMRGGGLRRVLLPGMYSKMLLTRQLLAQKLRAKGCLLAHAAGAARSGRAVVFHGRGGSYKTNVLMSMLRSSPEWRPLGDDGVILKENQALSFPTYPAIFGYRLAHKDTEHLTAFDRFRIVTAARLPADDAERTRYASRADVAVLVEMRAGGVDKLMIEEIPLDCNVTAMHHGMHLEQHNSVNMGFNDVYPQYVEAYSYIFQQNDFKTADNDGSGLAGTSSYRISFPLFPGQEDFIAVSSFINEIVCA